ncbi:transcriptional regulator with XRE-family HTH domain [Streptomyces griseochromogenes]|uniref:Transcriptional regulator with XRE-family HTH domain n=1 Tax=Streptomyces griseochromogenes TaxID=68214 RepID=A0ABS4LN08_9ACTN|nr:helix-turn-helix transcriptional regulator [Streptomyces griseochromogenes]MBP2048786.1 transcriptional regulator with XRE-family HTH domain [Streptomyces griseochromogenes]
MARRKDIDGSISVLDFHGKELRWQREKAGLSLEKLVEGSFYGKSLLSDIERGQRRIPLDLARHVDRVLSTDGFFERHCEDVRKARKGGYAEYFADVLELEEQAREIEEWDPRLIPGPLQLEPYIRAIVLAAYPTESEEDLAAKVAGRRSRAWLFEDKDSPESWVVLHESILWEPILPPNEMAEQLAHIVEVLRKRRTFTQLVLRNSGAHPFMMGPAKFMTFADAPSVMYTESMDSGQLIDDPVLVRQYSKAYGRLKAAALDTETSLRIIERAAEDYRNGKHHARLA